MSNIMQITGVILITFGASLFSIPLGIVVGGLFLTLVGLALGKQ